MDAAGAIVAWLKQNPEPLARYRDEPPEDELDAVHRRTLFDRLIAAAWAEQHPVALPDKSAMPLDQAEQTLSRKEVRGPFLPLRRLLDERAVDAPGFPGQEELATLVLEASEPPPDPVPDLSELSGAVRELAGSALGRNVEQDAQWDWAADQPDEQGAYAADVARGAVAQLGEALAPGETRATFLTAPRALAGLVFEHDRGLFVPLPHTARAARFSRLLHAAVSALLTARLGPVPTPLATAVALYAADHTLRKQPAARRGFALAVALEALWAASVHEADREGARGVVDRFAIAREHFGAGPTRLLWRVATPPWPTQKPRPAGAETAQFVTAVQLWAGLVETFGPDGIAGRDLPAALRDWTAAAPSDPLAQTSLIKAQLGVAHRTSAAVDWLFAMG